MLTSLASEGLLSMDYELTAQFFAELARCKDLSRLEPWEQTKLVSDLQKADLLQSPFSRMARAISKNKNFMNSWKSGGSIPGAWRAILSIHPWAYRVINALVDSGEVDTRVFHKQMLRPVQWKLENGRIESLYDPLEMAEKDLWVPFVRLMVNSNHLFPFRRCSLCKTIFVPKSKKQRKYCGKECGNKAVSLTPKRRKYMKDYMKEKREAEGDSNGDK
jgi:hypothetical protein